MSGKLPHYLRTERRRAGLSQRDIATLLGVRSESKVSRYERRQTLPPLKTALAYEAIFGRPVAELFGGTYDDVRKVVRTRAEVAMKRVPRVDRRAPRAARKKESLEVIASR